MTLEEFKLLTDENIHTDVVQFLRDEGFEVADIKELNLHGISDIDLLRRAVSENRVVVTHDADFGTLAILAGEPNIGIVYLRPGHIDPEFTKQTIHAVLDDDLDLVSPFIVAHRKGIDVNIRLRKL